jgi:hypothetical protein
MDRRPLAEIQTRYIPSTYYTNHYNDALNPWYEQTSSIIHLILGNDADENKENNSISATESSAG